MDHSTTADLQQSPNAELVDVYDGEALLGTAIVTGGNWTFDALKSFTWPAHVYRALLPRQFCSMANYGSRGSDESGGASCERGKHSGK